MTSSRSSNNRSRSRSASRTSVVKKPLATGVAVPKMTVAEIRAIIGDAQKEVYAKIEQKDLEGTIKQITSNLNAVAKRNKITGEFKVARKSIRSSGRYGYSQTHTVVIGTRPYTDEEVAKEGPKLIKKIEADKARVEKKRQKEIDDYNRLARKLGQPEITK